MVEEQIDPDQPALAMGVGEQLRLARLAQGLDLAQIAEKTRIPMRHLALIEGGDFAGLPGRTYAVGFSKTYARLLGLDQEEIARRVRAGLDSLGQDSSRSSVSFEPGDPARVPSSRLAWLSAGAALLLVLGALAMWGGFFAPPASLDPLADPAQRETGGRSPPAPPAADPSGAVVFTALEDGVWVSFYDRAGAQLMQRQMAKGESYTLPAAAAGPLLRTGRPDALAITVGGRALPRLADVPVLMKDIPVDGAALLARPPVPAAAPAAARPAGDPANSPTG